MICQMQQFVYIILEGATIVIVHALTHEQLAIDRNPLNIAARNPCAICCCQDMKLLLVAFTSGVIRTLSCSQNQGSMETSSFRYEIISAIERKWFLCMEVITIDENTNEIWCGCNNNAIVILSLMAEKTPAISQTIKNISGSDKMSCKVLQLKIFRILDLHDQLVCGLLDNGSIVCYNAGSKVCLKRISADSAYTGKHTNLALYIATIYRHVHFCTILVML